MRNLAVILLTVVTGLAVVRPLPAAVAYLPCIGPAPLRFELATAPGLAWAWKQLRVADKTGAAGHSAPPPAAATNDVATPTLAAVGTNTVLGATGAKVTLLDKNNAEPPPAAEVTPESDDDVTVPVTPQMLSGFFKPDAAGKTPGGSAGGKPGQIGFTPPTPKGGTESRAVYRVQ